MSRRIAKAPARTLDPPEATGLEPRRETSGKLGAVIAKQIAGEVLRGGWQVGQSLGSEQALMRRYKISRSTLREAIRQLEIHGLVKMIRGANGGLIVAEQPQQAAARALTIYLELLDAGIDELFEALRILEPWGARLAAERASEAELGRLRSLVEELEAAQSQLEFAIPRHLAIRNLIGEIAANPALAIFVGALNRYTIERIAHEVATVYAERNVARRTAFKRRIVEAIVAHNPAEAESAMRDDVGDRHSLLTRHFAEHARPEVMEVGSFTATPTGMQPKLGQVVAMTIAHEINRRGLAPGDRLGSEPDLLAKYGVSRAVFREAIRILEVHGFVRTRRGHLGGLIVAAPDPGCTIDSATEFLRASGLSGRPFQEIRSVIAVNTSRLAAERVDDKSRACLNKALAAQSAASPATLVRATRALHSLIGDLCGNRALAVFNRVVLELNSGGDETLPDDVAAEVKASNNRICAAVTAGDGALARRRMIEHMDDVARWRQQGVSLLR